MAHFGYTRAVQAGKELYDARKTAERAAMERDPVRRGEAYESAAGIAFKRAGHTLFSDPENIRGMGAKWSELAAEAFDNAGLTERAALNRQNAERHRGELASYSSAGLANAARILDEHLDQIAAEAKRET